MLNRKNIKLIICNLQEKTLKLFTQQHQFYSKNLPFELWEITKFENNTISLNQYLAQSKESINKIGRGKNNVISSVNKEVKVHNEDVFIKGLNSNQIHVSMK